jgi:hypothetical protein
MSTLLRRGHYLLFDERRYTGLVEAITAAALAERHVLVIDCRREVRAVDCGRHTASIDCQREALTVNA